jgi:ATP-binding cassette subfamily B protein
MNNAYWSRTRVDVPPTFSLRAQLHLLIGDKRALVLRLVGISITSGFVEAATLAIVAQVAAALVNRAKHVSTNIGPLHVHASVGKLILIGLALTLCRLALQWPLSTLPVRIASDVQASLRRRVFRAFTLAAPSIQAKDREGQLQEVMTSQTAQATSGALQATGLIIASLTFVIMLGSALALSAAAAAVVLGLAVLMFVILGPLRALGARRSRELSAAMVEYAGGIAESNRLSEESQVFGVVEAQYARLAELIDRCRRLFYRTQVIAKLVPNLYQSLIYLVMIIGLAVLYAYGGGHGGSVGAVVLLLLRASQSGQAVQSTYQALQQSLPFIERLEDSERRYSESIPVDGAKHLRSVHTLAFERVSYAYTPGRPVLSEISFSVEAGEAIGIIGPSGAGKSTLVSILLRLRAPESGRYLVNGEDVQEFARADWQKLVAYIPQEPRLLHASVAQNIRFFRDLDDESVERAARLARIHNDIMTWPQGYETIVGPRADAVSGGQQQRICLARALAAQPSVLVLDEPTSALDPQSETLIQESLSALKSGLTLFTIAHRMSTLDMCDRVMVILDGRLAAFDTKAALQESNTYYRTASLIAASAGGGVLP